MSKRHVTRYVCDGLACTTRAEADLGMWLCPERFETIDGWWYSTTRPLASNDAAEVS